MNLPKVLIVGQPFNNETGGGITLSNLFSKWEKGKLAVVCSPYLLNGNTNMEVCENYYQLGYKEHVWAFPFNVLSKKYPSGPFEFESQNPIPSENPSFRSKFVKGYLNPFLKWTGFSNSIAKYQLSKDLGNWLDKFQPDIIYAQAQRRDAVLLCSKIQNYLHKPMIFHMMDDWPELIKHEGLLGKFWYRKIDSEFRKLLSQTALHLSISESMAQEYESRYGYKWLTFHNPIDLDFWSSYQRNSYDLPENPVVLYAGRMGLGIQSSLEMMADVIDSLNQEMGFSLKLVLQVSQVPKWSQKYACVVVRGFVPYEHLPKHFAEADILFLPYDFSDSSLAFIKYSMPTKASEYMISGTPILVFAPKDTAIASYAEKYSWAKVVAENDKDLLKTALKSMLLHLEERRIIANNAINIAKDRHDAETVREKFRNTLSSLVVDKTLS
ncbi:glycosyltransferase [Negadavirga shengliensis]|uniref:Glycosyltransferase n=1 Tax=Negadavirga shengliensis TaxID=1389218 RepID=A0ABV9T3Q2_9BACT